MELSEAGKYSKNISSLFSTVLKAEVSSALSLSPLFQIPFIRTILLKIINFAIDRAIEKQRVFIFFKYIDMRSASQKNDYERAVASYEAAKLKGDKNEIARLEKYMLETFDNFVRFNSL